MIIPLADTTSAKISAELLRARRTAGSPAQGMVLTLIIVCDESEYARVMEASMAAGREHPSRILLVVTAGGRNAALDAELHIGEGTPGEVVVIRMRGAVAAHPASVIRPLLLPDSPVVIWWPGKAPNNQAGDELAQLAMRRLTDAAASPRPLVTLKARARDYTPGDTDLSWTRLTPWRALLAAALDQYPAKIKSVLIEADRGNPSADLLAAWLQSRLKIEVSRKISNGPGLTAVRMATAAGDIAITRPDGLLASYAVPGQPERLVALKRRNYTELISEELRRMDADDVYERAVKSLLDGGTGNHRRSPLPRKQPPRRPPPRRPMARRRTASRVAKQTAGRRWMVTTSPEILLHAGPDDVAEALAARLMARLTEIQRDFRIPQLALTGGRIATRAYQNLANEGPNSAVDWSRVELWWGDERFVPADHPDRNAKQALDLLAAPLALNPDRVHEMPASDGGLELDQAAESYARELDDVGFDICLLGMGPDGHVASIFPEHPSSYAEGAVIAVRSSPKPPPERISLTLPVINRSHEVWFVVSGADKAAAAKMALLGAGPVQVPAAGVSAVERTLWLMDRDAAAELPTDLQQRGRI